MQIMGMCGEELIVEGLREPLGYNGSLRERLTPGADGAREPYAQQNRGKYNHEGEQAAKFLLVHCANCSPEPLVAFTTMQRSSYCPLFILRQATARQARQQHSENHLRSLIDQSQPAEHVPLMAFEMYSGTHG